MQNHTSSLRHVVEYRKPNPYRYAEIRAECAIVTACDARHAPYLFNALASLDEHFTDRPGIVLYDLGLSWLQKLELRRFRDLEIRPMPHFVAHWRTNWSWKLLAMTNVRSRIVLYLDLANMVIQRSLAPWFVSIESNGYLLVSNGQRLGEITPSDYWALHGLRAEQMEGQPTFGAGIVGFDRTSNAYIAILRAFDLTLEGFNLGRSEMETNRKYRPDIVRDCACFRADQTLLNLAFRQAFGKKLQIRRAGRYSGYGGPNDHPSQYLWYARRNPESLIHLQVGARSGDMLYVVNRALWYARIVGARTVKRFLLRLRRS